MCEGVCEWCEGLRGRHGLGGAVPIGGVKGREKGGREVRLDVRMGVRKGM